MNNEHIAEGIVKAYAKRQQAEYLPCPKCGEWTMKHTVNKNALSRVTISGEPRGCAMICDGCGIREAMEAAFLGGVASLSTWIVVTEIQSKKV